MAGVLALQACKHPLAIVGEGDIVDINNTGHGCTLEQFQAGGPACTENEVTGDYDVNYMAESRPGSRFVRWEGPCAQVSDFQYCRIESEEEWVVWMDDNYPDYEFPPSTAVFEPITGEIGYLVDGAVAGVAYESPSYQGFTNLDGSFQYAEGEKVRFKIGDTLLGEVTGQPQVTPFDLAGSEVITGTPNIMEALDDENDPFHTVINAAVLLQSLDHDADPENGLNIRQSVAALFDGVVLNLSQEWESFHDDPSLRQTIWKANNNGGLSMPHGVVNPAPALQNLYGALEVDAQTSALISGTTIDNRGGWPDCDVSYEYDTEGNLSRLTISDWFPVEESDYQQKYEYDARGNITRIEEESHANLGDYGIMREIFSEARQYDNYGNMTRRESLDGEGVVVDFDTWRHDSKGNPIRHVNGEDGIPFSVSIGQYE